MRRLLPAFVQRRLLLSAARRALQAGRPEQALAILHDELLAKDARAAGLRTLILPLIATPPPAPPRPEPVVAESRDDLRELLAQMRAGRAENQGRVAGGACGATAAALSTAPTQSTPCARPARMRMSLDDAGSFLICAGTSASVGHSRAGEADVPILADLLPRHARFVLEPPSFHAGASWRVEPIGSARVSVAAEPLGAAVKSLQPGDRIRLGEHCVLRFEQPDRTSLSASLDLEADLEAAGARRILLFASGSAGRLSIGAKGTRHVQAQLGGVELELVHDGVRLRIHCASGMIPDEAQESPAQTDIELPLQLVRPLHLRLCMQSASERPRWISFAPLEDV